jgi:hypothetical protein
MITRIKGWIEIMVRSLMITIAVCNGCFAFIFVIYAGFDLAHICYKIITLFFVNQVLIGRRVILVWL